MGFKNSFWQPGCRSCLELLLKNVVEKQLLERGVTKEEIGREKFLELCWEQKKNSQNKITNQLRVLGVSPAWSRERFTMDDGLA